MAEEVVSLCASGGHLSVTRLSLTYSLHGYTCQAFHKHRLNYISEGGSGKGWAEEKESEWTGLKKKRAGAKIKKERNWLWIRVLDSSEMQEN